MVASFLEVGLVPLVSLVIGLELGAPIGGVGLGGAVALAAGALVPVAAVDEDGDFGFAENDVGFAGEVLDVLAVATKPGLPEGLAERLFGLRAARAVPLHGAACGFGDDEGVAEIGEGSVVVQLVICYVEMTRDELKPWIIEALHSLGGKGSVLDVAQAIRQSHERDLRDSGDMFFKWQYEFRHAGTILVAERKIVKSSGFWLLVSSQS